MIQKFIKKLLFKLRKREVWTIGVYCLKGEFDFNFISENNLAFTYSDSGKKYSKEYRSICADPFLISKGKDIYLFFETKNEFSKGEISCVSFNRNNYLNRTDHGVVLSEPFHLSFPNVFKLNDDFFMLPECAASGSVIIYKAEIFPTQWKKYKVIVDIPLVDVGIHFTPDGCNLLGMDRKGVLNHFFSKDLFSDFNQVQNVVSDDLIHMRNGGNFTLIKQQLFRFAQKSSNYYGEGLRVKKIDQFDHQGFRESDTEICLVQETPEYMIRGHHHISILKDNDLIWVAIDGFKKDTLVNLIKFMYLKFKLINRN